jgi:hypothetical protein
MPYGFVSRHFNPSDEGNMSIRNVGIKCLDLMGPHSLLHCLNNRRIYVPGRSKLCYNITVNSSCLRPKVFAEVFELQL